MDDLKRSQLGMIFTSSFLGAGFVSGQEIMQFFGVFGKMGVVGMFLSIALFAAFGFIFMYLAKREKTTAIDRIIMGEGNRVVRAFFNGMSLLFLFGVTVIMLAGAGSLFNQLLGIPYFVGSAILTVLLALLSLKGIKGILVVSQAVVPILLVMVVIMAIWSYGGLEPAQVPDSQMQSDNPLLGNWLLSTLSFFSYNILASLAVLAPVAQKTRDMKTIVKGIIQGSLQLLMMFACILLSMQRYFGLIGEAVFPMQALAERLSPMLGLAYTLLLLAAMFSGALSCMYGAIVQLFGNENGRGSIVLALWAAAFVCSLAGFKELISVIFPVCGYAYLGAMPLVLVRFFKVYGKANNA